MAFFSFPLMFLQAGIGALVFSTAAWLVLHLARRRWPGPQSLFGTALAQGR